MDKVKRPEVTLHVNLKPTSTLSSKAQNAFWHRVLDIDFRSSIGRPKTDHMNTGSGGESHVLYTLDTMEIAFYSRGDVTIEDDHFESHHSARIERILNASIRALVQAAGKRLRIQIDAYIHVVFSNKSIGKFLLRNIQFSPTGAFRKVFAPARIATFILRISKNLSIAFVAANHLDFMYFDMFSTGTKRKVFLSKFAETYMRYLKALEKRG
jgi:hypothetical protein